MLRATLPMLLVALVACSKGPAPGGVGSTPTRASGGALVARVGATELREDDLRRAIEREPGASPIRFDSPEARQALVDGLVRFELLAQAADRAGFTKDPDAVQALKQIAVTKLVNQELGAAASPSSITPEDLQREYEARQATDYTLPPAAQVRLIRVSSAKQAAGLAARARALPAEDDRAFAELATANSEDEATRGNGGDLGFVDRRSRLPSAIVDAALSLSTPGQVTEPLEIDAGYVILRLVARRAAVVSPLSSVAEPLRQRLYRERRAAALESLIARLRKETPVEVVSGVTARAP